MCKFYKLLVLFLENVGLVDLQGRPLWCRVGGRVAARVLGSGWLVGPLCPERKEAFMQHILL